MTEDGDAGDGVEVEMEDGDATADPAPDAGGTAENGHESDGAGTEDEGGETDDLVARVAEADDELLAQEIATLQEQVADLEEERADLEDRLKRKQAEFQNYKKRMKKRREQEQKRATEDLVERLLDVRDNLKRALDQEEGADIRGGVETTLNQFDRVLDAENVESIEPAPGDEVDPQRHEVLLRVESAEPEGTVAEVHRPGYEMADKVLQTAQVTVSEGREEDGDGNEE